MKVNISGKNENAVLGRTELSFTVEDASVPPSRKELREKIAALQNVKPEQVIVAKIEHGFGSKQIGGKAKIYASVKDLEETELPYLVGRNKGVKKGKETEAPKAEKPAEEKPSEPKKEEKTSEKKEGE